MRFVSAVALAAVVALLMATPVHAQSVTLVSAMATRVPTVLDRIDPGFEYYLAADAIDTSQLPSGELVGTLVIDVKPAWMQLPCSERIRVLQLVANTGYVGDSAFRLNGRVVWRKGDRC